MEFGKKFLGAREIKEEAKHWRKQALRYERKNLSQYSRGSNYGYQALRGDNSDLMSGLRFMNPIDQCHRISFINEVIPALIAKKRPGEKVKILDVGAGMTLFANQIRQKFGDKVKVLSTGLSKQAFRTQLKWQESRGDERVKGLPKRLHNDDLKWRSIKELSNYQEFDLIVDTLGEFFYDSSLEVQKDGVKDERDARRIFKYLIFVSLKLRPGGLAFLYPIVFGSGGSYSKERFENDLNLQKAEWGIEYELVGAFGALSGPYALRIKKNPNTQA